jgi:hypothetical protein
MKNPGLLGLGSFLTFILMRLLAQHILPSKGSRQLIWHVVKLAGYTEALCVPMNKACSCIVHIIPIPYSKTALGLEILKEG